MRFTTRKLSSYELYHKMEDALLDVLAAVGTSGDGVAFADVQVLEAVPLCALQHANCPAMHFTTLSNCPAMRSTASVAGRAGRSRDGVAFVDVQVPQIFPICALLNTQRLPHAQLSRYAIYRTPRTRGARRSGRVVTPSRARTSSSYSYSSLLPSQTLEVP